MNKSFLKKLKTILPIPIRILAVKYWDIYKRYQFVRQSSSFIMVGGLELEIPKNHPLPGLMNCQPYRDLCVGITARFVSEKYPTQTMIDIGANIGDTAAIISKYCSNHLLLVEASDFFHKYLVRNVLHLTSTSTIKKVLVADGNVVTGELFHWGGTAVWRGSEGATKIKTERLADLTKDKVCFVKTDTDGYDYKILLAGIDWISVQKPVIIFESQISNRSDIVMLGELIESLKKADYDNFVVWDDAGVHLFSTSDHDVILDAHCYLLKSIELCAKNSISNLDVACFHKDDRDIADNVTKWWRNANKLSK